MKANVISFLSSLIRAILRFSPPAVSNNVKNDLLEKLDVYNDAFTTYHSRPKQNIDCTIVSTINNIQSMVAIVIQGPIVESENFTIETTRLYKKSFKNHIIIVSTWEDIEERLVVRLKKEKVIVVLSKKPDCSGPLNINLQIESSKAGIQKAKELGAEYIYKSRTDQRMYQNCTRFLLELQQTFPVNSEMGQTERLIACSFTTLKYRPYGIGDMLMFGHISDMLDYWDSEFDPRNIEKREYENLSILNYAKMRFAETYLCTNYLLKKNYHLSWSLEDSWKVYSEMFCIVNAEMFDLFWFKYEWRVEKRFNFYKFNTMQCLQFTDWLEIKNNWNQLLIDENILNKREGVYL